MSGTDQTEAEIRRADRARVLMEEGVFQEAWAELESRIYAEWRRAPVRDAEGREGLWQMLRAMDNLKNVLDGYVQDGVVSREILAAADRDRAVNGQ